MPIGLLICSAPMIAAWLVAERRDALKKRARNQAPNPNHRQNSR